MILYPAVDLMGGRVVRLRHGERDAATVYSDDPVAVARRWESDGAEWLHVVDLDRAFGEGRDNREAVKAIARGVTIPIQLGGGLRSDADVAEALSLGVERVILGTRAVRDRDWLKNLVLINPEQIAVAIDARKGIVGVQGWTEETDVRALDFALELAKLGVPRLVVTDIDRDGSLEGVNLGLAERIARATRLKVIASGGLGSASELERLRALSDSGIEGVVVGRALYEGVFTLREALTALGAA